MIVNGSSHPRPRASPSRATSLVPDSPGKWPRPEPRDIPFTTTGPRRSLPQCHIPGTAKLGLEDRALALRRYWHADDSSPARKRNGSLGQPRRQLGFILERCSRSKPYGARLHWRDLPLHWMGTSSRPPAGPAALCSSLEAPPESRAVCVLVLW